MIESLALIDWISITLILVFGITGSLSVGLSKPFLNLIEIDRATISPLVYWPMRILIIFPVYQILLLIIGSLFGQYEFFKNFIIKIFKR